MAHALESARTQAIRFSLLFRLAGFGKHGMGGLHLPAGGMGTIADALADAARRNGAVIRTEARVERILVEKDAATGVGAYILRGACKRTRASGMTVKVGLNLH